MGRIHGIILATLFLGACSSGTPDGQVTAAIDENGDPVAPSAADARKLIGDWLATRPACAPFFAMPWDVAVDSPVERRRAQAFVDAGLLRLAGNSSFPGAVAPRPALRYAPSADGERFLRPGGKDYGGAKTIICYGTIEPQDASIESADPMMQRATLHYRFRLADVPAWTNSPGITALYPWLERRLAEEGEGRADLIFRDGHWKIDNSAPPLMLDLQQLSH